MTSPTLRLELRSSPRLAAALSVAHIGAAGCLFPIELPVSVKLIVGAGLIISLVHTLCRHALRCSAHSICELGCNPEGEWELSTRRGESFRGVRLSSSYVHPELVALSFRVGRWRRRSVILLPDALNAGDLRRLRVHLRLEGARAAN